jgi:hypothetical protein
MPIGEVISYRDAMKMFNNETFDKSLWGIPRKGYAGYNAVQHIRKGEPHKHFTTIAQLKKAEDPISVPTKKQQEKAKADEDKKKKAEEEKKKKAEEDKAKAEKEAKKVKSKLKKLEKEKKQLEQVVTEMQEVIVEEAPQIALEIAEIVEKVNVPVIELSSTIPDNTFFTNVLDSQAQKNILSDTNIQMPPPSLSPPTRPTESGLNDAVVDKVEQMDTTTSVAMPTFAPNSTWIPDDFAFYEQLQNNLNLKKRDYRFRPKPVSLYPSFVAKVDELSKMSSEKQVEVSDANNNMYKQKVGTPEYVTAREVYMKLRQEQTNIDQDRSVYRRQKEAMESWKPHNQVVYEFDYDGYNPQKIIDKLPEGKIGKQLAWIINERSTMMKKVNENRGNPIRTVTFDLVLNDKDAVFVQCSWDITRASQGVAGYYTEQTHSHFLEEYKLSDASEVPNKFQSAETIHRMKTKEAQEKEKAEAKLNNGYGKGEINGHNISYKGRTESGDYQSGKYDELYVTVDAKKINDTTIVEEVPSENGYGKRRVWKDENVNGKISYDGGVVIKVNRIDTVAKKFFYNIIGYALQDGYTAPHEFIPYQDTKEREGKTTTKQGSVNIPFDKLDIAWKVPATEQKKVEVIKRAEGDDGRHHFKVDGFNASSSNNTKASMKNAIYDDFVYVHIYKNGIGKEEAGYDPIITGFNIDEFEKISKPRMKMVDDYRTGKPKEQMHEDHFSLVAKWLDKSKGQADIIGYYVSEWSDDEKKAKSKVLPTHKQYFVQFPFKKSAKKFNKYEIMKVEEFDMSEMVGKA